MLIPGRHVMIRDTWSVNAFAAIPILRGYLSSRFEHVNKAIITFHLLGIESDDKLQIYNGGWVGFGFLIMQLTDLPVDIVTSVQTFAYLVDFRT